VLRERPYPTPIWWPCPQYSAPRHDELRQCNKQATPLAAFFHERVPDKGTIVTGGTTPLSPGRRDGHRTPQPVELMHRHRFDEKRIRAQTPAYSRMSGRCGIAIWVTMVCTYDLTSAAAKTSIKWCRDASSISEN
jgi:hypothetical protein